MATTIQYKTLTLAQKNVRNKTTFSRAESVYTPNLFNEHLIKLIKPSASLLEIEQTIFEKNILSSLKTNNPLYSFVWFLN